MHSERPKLYTILAFLSAVGLRVNIAYLFDLFEIFTDTVINQIPSARTLSPHHEWNESFVKHVRCADYKDCQGVIFIRKSELLCYMVIVPTYLKNKNVHQINSPRIVVDAFFYNSVCFYLKHK